MIIAAIIVAAGRGSRAQRALPKQWQLLAGRPVVAHALAAFAAAPRIGPVILVAHPDDMDRARAVVAPDVRLVPGGATRRASVRAGLEAVRDTAGCVLIHDAARPCLSPALIARVIDALAQGPAAAPALPVTDALWQGEAGLVTGLHDRTGLFRAQTPQGFHTDAILSAHRRDTGAGNADDDVAIARRAGLPVRIVEGEADNLKITYPGDFARAEKILRGQMDIRMGTGFDVHRFGPGDKLTLCGVSLPHDRTLQGHSDADVGIHALADAIYGALAEGDIGRHFPPSDPQWKGAESHVFLRHAARLVSEKGFRISNLDVTLICELPRIGPHAAAMRAALARITGTEICRISVKATTSERLGFTGRGEGIAAQAAATLVKP